MKPRILPNLTEPDVGDEGTGDLGDGGDVLDSQLDTHLDRVIRRDHCLVVVLEQVLKRGEFAFLGRDLLKGE